MSDKLAPNIAGFEVVFLAKKSNQNSLFWQVVFAPTIHPKTFQFCLTEQNCLNGVFQISVNLDIPA